MNVVTRKLRFAGLASAAALVLLSPPLLAVTRPAEVSGVLVDRQGGDVVLSWDATTLDIAGQPETAAQYKVYRGTTPDFVPDKSGGSNLVGTSPGTTFDDTGVAPDPNLYFYRVSAEDADGNESNTFGSVITTLPFLSGDWNNGIGNAIDLDWTAAAPGADVISYRVYYGRASGGYESVDDVLLNLTHTLTGLEVNRNWYSAVTAIDGNGNETPLSNEHIDSPNGLVLLRAHQQDELCWGGGSCTPADPNKVQRRDGFQLMVPVDFPEGDWVSVKVQLTLDSRLCTPPNGGTISKCGPNNPCVDPPCNGGYNPHGDPWDRTAHLFVVLDDCIAQGGSCITPNNLELIRAVTPFGTDAPVAQGGTGVVPTRKLLMDVTPFAPLLTGSTHVGVDITHFTQKGHWVTVDFIFSEIPAQASPKPPADGIEIIGFGGAPLPVRQVTIPATATDVKMRLFTTGHGGSQFCDGGANNANPCTGAIDCPGGACVPCDEFCHRMNRIKADGNPIWQAEPWRSDCSPPGNSCSNWNACGFPSCTFSRAGWCPGYIACHHNAPCDNDLDFPAATLPRGATYDFDYDVLLQNGSWSVSLVLYWYE